MFSKDEVIKNINGLIDSAGRTSGSLSAHYERRVDGVEAAESSDGSKEGTMEKMEGASEAMDLYGELFADALDKAYKVMEIPAGSDQSERIFAAILEAADAIRLAEGVKARIEAGR